MGENFWQFRRYASHDSAGAIDWRQSAKSQHIFVREREWEAAQTVWFWRDASANMAFKSGTVSKRTRADLLLLALASLLVRGGEAGGICRHGWRRRGLAPDPDRIGRALFPKATPRCRHACTVRAWQPTGLVQRFLADGVVETMRDLSRRGGGIGPSGAHRRSGGRSFPYAGTPLLDRPWAMATDFRPRRAHPRLYHARFVAHGEESFRRRPETGLDLHHASHRSRATALADRNACRHRRYLTPCWRCCRSVLALLRSWRRCLRSRYPGGC